MARRFPNLVRTSLVFAFVALAAFGLVAGPRLVNAQDSASASFASGDAVVVDTDALNLRSDATTAADVIAVLDTGAGVTVVDGPVSADGYEWYEVSTDAGDGWVDGEYLNTTLTYTAASAAGYAAGDSLVVDTDTLNLRSDATTDADVVAQLATGDSVSVVSGPVSADGYDWYQVDAVAGSGWVAGEFLNTSITYTAATDTTTGTLGFAIGDSLIVDTDTLNIRTDATIDADVAAQLVAGDSVTITDGPVSADGYEWYGISSDAGDGWVAGDYLGTAVTLSSETSSAFAAGSNVLVDTDVLNVRADATTEADTLEQLVTNDGATVLAGPVSADGYAWYQVETYDGTVGWIAGEFLALA